ncbi:hypothetical protein KA043_02850 [Candidatus Saccharibacteria bacterium]|nr:hypothetical protein [Candidatus Saccharibacteria bacterium]
MTIHDGFPSAEGNNERQLNEIKNTIEGIKNIVGVDFVEASELRDQSVLPEGYENTPEKELEIRGLASNLGIGRSEDLGLSEAGFPEDSLVIVEGGQGHKMLAELKLSLEYGSGPIIISASRHREVKSEKEIDTTSVVLGIEKDYVGSTEYEVASQIARLAGLVDFDGTETEVSAIPHGLRGKPNDGEEQGSVIKIGTINGRDVCMYDVPREYYDDDGQAKYRQPSPSEQVENMAKIDGVSSVVLATSSTYMISRLASIVSAGNNSGVIAYGAHSLARAKKEAKPTEPSLEQILAEVSRAEKLIK